MNDIFRIELSEDEVQILIDALGAITRTGGGSPEHTLAEKLEKETGLRLDEVAAIRYQITAERELGDDRVAAYQMIDQIDHDMNVAVTRLDRGSPDCRRG